jgi:integrase
MSVGEYLDQWLRDYAAIHVAPRTRERYTEICRLNIIPSLGFLPLTRLEPQHIQDFYSRALKEGRKDGKGGLSPRSVYHIHRILFEALKHAVKRGLLMRNPAEAVDPPRPGHREMTALTAEQLARFLEAARETPYHILFYIAAYTGLRRSELLALQWQDIDLNLAVLSVLRTLHRLKSGEYVFGEPKSRRSRRQVDLSPSVAILLRKHREEQEATFSLLGMPLTDSDLVFSGLDGQPISPDAVTKAFQRLSQRLGFRKLRFHDLRHTHATLLLQQGVHPKIVSERLGHSSVAITLDTYSHVLPGLQRAAAQRFDKAMQVATEESVSAFVNISSTKP